MRKGCVECYIKSIILSISVAVFAVGVLYFVASNEMPTPFLFFLSSILGLIVGVVLAKLVNMEKKAMRLFNEEKEKLNHIHSYIGTVVHDLRSPAASINMVAEFLEEELTELPDVQRNLVGTIKKSSTLMLERIGGILDNTRIEKGINIDHLTEGNPAELLAKVVDNHRILALDKDISLLNLISENLPSTCFDSDALESVLGNLISNAIKYSPRNTIVRIFHRTEKNRITILVKDEGLGMTEDDLHRVFGEFTKLSARPTAGEGSSGLGLSIVKKLVEQMGGTVKAESEGQDRGSTFSFTLKTVAKVKTLTA